MVALLLFGVSALAACGPSEPLDNWPQFRGPGALPVSENPGLPSTWSTTENVEWVAEIEGVGWSSPIVWGDRVFVTAAVSEGEMKGPSLGVDFSNDYVAELSAQGLPMEEVIRLTDERDAEFPDEVTLEYALYSIDLESGEIVWRKPFHEGHPPVGRHRKNSYTSETPVTDGEAVYVYVAFLGLYAFDFDGNQLWHTPLEPHQVYLEFGSGASPALYEDRIFVLNDNEEASFVAAFDKNTGEQLWYTPREGLGSQRIRSAWSTPFVWDNELRTEVVTMGPGWVISYDLDGDELWRMSRFSASPIQSPFAWNGLLYVTSGVAGEQTKPVAAIRPGGAGESDTGIFSKYDPATGERLYRSRIHPTARNFTASPWAYDGKIFVLNEEGDTFVASCIQSETRRHPVDPDDSSDDHDDTGVEESRGPFGRASCRSLGMRGTCRLRPRSRDRRRGCGGGCRSGIRRDRQRRHRPRLPA